MRDAQIEAIKTYLYLKIACKGLPLYRLFADGYFNDTNIDNEELTAETYKVLESNPAALALFQYSRLKDKNGNQIANELEKYIRHHAKEVDYEKILLDIFYGINYADYLFSLPMGAGKTYLMAAFIYIDLYFALNEPENTLWSHNFLIAVPASLKSSIIPSLKDIRNFDPTWVLPEASAKAVQRVVKFEVLEDLKNPPKSTMVRDPNAWKVSMHVYSDSPIGLIAVANAEKLYEGIDSVIGSESLYDKAELLDVNSGSELRRMIRKLPHLSVFIDEVHHATDGEIKLRKAVTEWAMTSKGFCNVVGFSGTPYLDKAAKTTIGGDFVVKNTNISNVVYYYPLVDGIDNFLKHPSVKVAGSMSSEEIIENGVREFMDQYKDTVYADGTKAKLAIYCGLIPTLEETVYPLVSQIVTEYGFNPAEVILKHHNGNKQFPKPEGSETVFTGLHSPLSPIRIVLLAQIGKEGWDCKSLTGVILPHEKSCPPNMVLQTSCRCLRQVIRGQHETALIMLNAKNADKLNKELKQQQNITLKEFAEKPQTTSRHIERYSRMDQLKLPKIDFYQFQVKYKTFDLESQPDIVARLSDPNILRKLDTTLVTVQDIEGNVVRYEEWENKSEDNKTFHWWLQEISRESFGTLSIKQLLEYESQLRDIYNKTRSADYDHQYIRSMIRKAFVPKRDYRIEEEIIPKEASILTVENLKAIDVVDDSRIYPDESAVNEILDWDAHPEKGDVPQKTLQIVEQMKCIPGMTEQMIQAVLKDAKSVDQHPERMKTYHYLPYKFDSSLEVGYFKDALQGIMKDQKLEYYYNGDDNVTAFKIDCYRKCGNHWQLDGRYVPDFLIVSRTDDGKLDRICIIETKGKGYAEQFKERLEFMRDKFVPLNNEKFGRERFRFLYLEDTITPQERAHKTLQMINEFFKNKQ